MEYSIDYGRRKNVYILIRDGKVILKVPKNYPKYKMEKIINEKEKWINKKLQEYNQKNRNVREYKDGANIYVLGNKYTLKIKYYSKTRIMVKLEDSNFVIYFPENLQINEELIKEVIGKYYCKLAKIELPKYLENVVKKVNLYPSSCSVRNMKRAWGNCNTKKAIHLNTNLIKYSKQAIEYVCLHEICHLKYMNHSKDFWKMVESYMPNYKEIEKELR